MAPDRSELPLGKDTEKGNREDNGKDEEKHQDKKDARANKMVMTRLR